MNLIALKDKIKSHLVAGYPGLYIQSSEEARVDAMLGDIATQLQLSPKEWNLGYGWVDFFNKQPRGGQDQDTQLANSLMSLLDDDLTGKLLIIKDAKDALENQPLAVARLKQLLNRIQRHQRGEAAVILVSETLFIPPQIEAQITLLPLPLPRGDEIATQLESLCQQLGLQVPEPLRQRLNAACSGLSQEEIQLALAMVRQHHEQINDAALAMIQHEKEQIIAKSGVLEMIKVSESASDIGGLENLKQWLTRRAQIFRRLDEAEQSRVPAPKGVLIAGMPGCGKSLTAKAAAGLFQLPLLRLDIGSLLGKYVGESEHNMRRALTMAESVSPCILWIDELEKAFVGMNSGSGSEVSSRLFGYFLTWMQEKTGAVFVIATANNITALPPELLRKGRFDEVFYVGFPNGVERDAILNIHLKGEKLELSAEQRKKLVTQCRDYAGADIQNAINEARESAFLDSRPLTVEDIESSIERTVPLRETLREQVGKYEELFEKLKLKPASTSDGLSVAQMIQMADSHNALRREEVANSGDCPDDLLEKLCTDPELKVRTAVYSNPNCPERVLTQRINIAEGQPGFDLALLHLACVHAHAPHDLLAAQFARLKLGAEQRLLLARKSPVEALHHALVNDEQLDVRQALAQNKQTSAAIQKLLAKDSKAAVRLSLASNYGLPVEVQTLLAIDDSFDVREALTRLDDLAETVQLAMTRDADLDVRLELAARCRDARLPDTVQLELVKDSPEVRLQLADNESLCAPAQLLLAQDPLAEVRKVLAGHPALGNSTVQYLAKDIEVVQEALAGNRHLGSALLHMGLSRSPSDAVRQALAWNPQLHAEVQAHLAKDANSDVRLMLAGNNNATHATLELLMRDANKDVRSGLFRRRDGVLPSVQRHLVHDTEGEVRKYLADARDLLEDVQQLLADDIADVQKELAGNTGITAAVQQQLLSKGLQEVRLGLARNSAAVGAVQAMLADDSDVEVRCALASNRQLVPEVAEKLMGDIHEVQVALTGNQTLSEAQYMQLYRTGDNKVRTGLAGNARISEAMMRQISQTELYSHADEVSDTAPDPESSAFGGFAGMAGMWRTASMAASIAEVAARAANPKAAGSRPAAAKAAAPVKRAAGLHLRLLRNRQLPADVQDFYLSSAFSSEELMAALATNLSLSESAQAQLANHGQTSVRQKLAANESVAAAVQRTLLNDKEASVRAALVRDWHMDAEHEAQLAEDTATEVRLALAGNRYLRKRTQLLLARDSNVEIRARLMDNKGRNASSRLKSVVLSTLSYDADLKIREQLAHYPWLTPTVQLKLAGDESVSVRKALAAQTDIRYGFPLSEEVQRRLQQDSALNIRLALAQNLRLLPTIQVLLARDAQISVKKALIDATNRWGARLSLDAQHVLAADPDAEVRAELASKLFDMFAPATSEEILLQLAGDPDESVKAAIIASLRFGGEALSDAVKARLLEGLDDDTRESVEELLESCEED